MGSERLNEVVKADKSRCQ